MAQKIIDLDVVVPEKVGAQIDGVVYDLPGDIPVPDYLEIARLADSLDDEADDGADPEAAGEKLQALYDRVMDLFRVHQPDLDELPIGPQRLASLVVQLYTGLADQDEPERPTKPRRAGTRSTSPKRKPKSAS